MSDAPGASSVRRAARAFDRELHTPDYAHTHSDPGQLERLLDWLRPVEKRHLVDLGTGAGYVASALASRNPTDLIVGLDVAREALRRNASEAHAQGQNNLHYVVIDGTTLPFKENAIGGLVTRFAYHHFPFPELSLREISRVLADSGRFVFSDAVRSEADDFDFINKFQALKRDGHIEMLTAAELRAAFLRHGFRTIECFDTRLSFDRQLDPGHESLLEAATTDILDIYQVTIEHRRIRLTFPIFNALLTRDRGVR